MERTSDKNSPRIDDAMAHDVAPLVHGAPEESRAQESRVQEDPGIGPGVRPGSHEAAGLGISEDDAARRADLARHLASVAFPARKDHLVLAAEEAFAPLDVVERLRGLPAEEQYDNVQSVWVAVGGPAEDRHT